MNDSISEVLRVADIVSTTQPVWASNLRAVCHLAMNSRLNDAEQVLRLITEIETHASGVCLHNGVIIKQLATNYFEQAHSGQKR